MTLTTTATVELAKLSQQIGFSFEMKTNFSESNSWSAVDFRDLQLRLGPAGRPARLTASLLNPSLLFKNERSKTNRVQLLAQGRLVATVGSESARIFSGRLFRKTLRTANGASIYAHAVFEDWLAAMNESLCQAEAQPSTIEAVPDGSYRALADLGFGADMVYGLTANGHGTLAVTGGSQGSQQFTVSGDYSSEFVDGVIFTVIGSTGNDGCYTVASSSFGGGTTTITVDEAIPSATFDGSITDAGFDEATNTVRRAFDWNQVELYYDDGGMVKLPSEHYEVHRSSGAFQIREAPDTPRSYFVSNLRCVMESKATGATNVDWARFIEAALATATDAASGPGMAAMKGTRPITAVSTGSKTFTVAGDWTGVFVRHTPITVDGSTGNDGNYTVVSSSFGAGSTVITVEETVASATADGRIRTHLVYGYDIVGVNTGSKLFSIPGDQRRYFPAGKQLTIQDSTGNDGIYTVASNAYDSGNDETDLTVNETVADSTADGVLLPDTGYDFAYPRRFDGRVRELVNGLQADLHSGLRLAYDSEHEKFVVYIAAQKSSGSPDFEAQRLLEMEQEMTIRDLYTSAQLRGQRFQPTNAIAENETALDEKCITDTGSGTYFAWDGYTVGADSTFSATKEYLWDGNHRLGCSVHDLASSHGGGTDKYDSIYPFVQYDHGSVDTLDRIILTLPPSRHPDHQRIDNKDGTWLWPLIIVESSTDGSTWYPVAPALNRIRYKPGHRLDIPFDEMTKPRGRYFRVRMGAYKHGYENNDDPSIGLGELILFFDENYTITRSLVATTSPLNYTYQDGSTLSRNASDLMRRLGGRHRVNGPLEYGKQIPESVAHDVAVKLLDEGSRTFTSYSARVAADPRVRLDDTFGVTDPINGDAEFLVEGITLDIRAAQRGRRPAMASTIDGTDYQQERLDNS